MEKINESVESKDTLLANLDLGVNVVGHVSSPTGLGTAVRGNIKSMEALNIPLKIHDLKLDSLGKIAELDEDFGRENPYPINLVQTNPNTPYYERIGSQYFQDRYNIGYWAWEMLNFPPSWQFAFDFFDEIWTLSSYCAESISAVSPIPVIAVRPSIELPKPSLKREDFGLAKDKFIFLFMFDFGSIVERKNPFAVIQAFQEAFNKSNRDVLLVIKFRPHEFFQKEQSELKAMAKDWKSIQFIEGNLSKDEAHGLVYNCDCYVSLHRAEGFGLTMAEAMFYGKPVIATPYSGNIDFMNVGNSFLVKYELVATTENYGPYPKGSIWADPDVEDAAFLMKYVFENPQESLQVGNRAALEIRDILSSQAVGAKIKNRLRSISDRINSNTSLSTHNSEIYVQRDSLECQAIAWKEAARQLQKELELSKSQLEKISNEVNRLKTT